MDRLPSLNAIRSFVAAARSQSFTAAAQELHVTQGAVSRMVQALELELGIQLFNRNGRFITLTQAGQTYYQEVSLALQRISDATRKIRQEEAGQALQLVVNSGFAIRWLMPRLPAFQQQYPNIEVHILGGETDTANTTDNAQLIIRYGNGVWPGMNADALPVGTLMGVICSPQLKASRELNRPADLLQGPLLTHTATARSGFWGDYFASFGLPQPQLDLAPRFYQLLLLAEAAMGGLGFALVPLFLFQPELESGRLVKAIPHTFTSTRGYYATYPPGADHDLKVNVFKRWLMQQAEQSRLHTEALWRYPEQ
ncbi:LysR substrate-binding domain-containing protein [Pseudomonas sp. MPC6]|uniref:LysR substrate-binding domain-containing protein n=1 Tax=unclassified Pseudomonas TaxID=196821 RepID=UPI001110B74E|nr:LysR substrate-binding domain-containing protein [Pseudomonas sp. MPC6]QCY14748.1 LysR family transcriptional regulator [Pseudomonas sp. MPC6]